MSLATALESGPDGSVKKPRAIPRRVFVWVIVVLCMMALLSFAGYLIVQTRMAVPQAVVSIAWPNARSPVAPRPPAYTGRGLKPAPDPRLIETLPIGLVPKIADDGTRPAMAYARPVAPVSGPLAESPRVAILITGAGIGQLATVEAMVKLPADISIGLSPYSSDIERQAGDIRGEGHEIFLDMPVAQRGEAYGGAGPSALSDLLDADLNLHRLRWALSRLTGYVGVNGHFADRLIGNGPAMASLSEVSERGLALFDLASDQAPLQLDSTLQSQAIDTALAQLEQNARTKGQAIGLAGTTPLTIDRIKNWSAGLTARGFRLVPVSALLPKTGVQ